MLGWMMTEGHKDSVVQRKNVWDSQVKKAADSQTPEDLVIYPEDLLGVFEDLIGNDEIQ